MFFRKNTSTQLNGSLIESGLYINGNIECSGNITIEGRVTGDVRSTGSDDTIMLSKSGVISGNVFASHLVVAGQIKGNVNASGITKILDSAIIDGDLYYTIVDVSVGATINGQLKHQQPAKKGGPDLVKSVLQ